MRIIKLVFVGLFLLSLSSVVSAQDSTALTPAQQRKFDYFFIEALRLKAQGDYEKAIQYYRESLKINPQSAVCRYEVASLFAGQADKKDVMYTLFLDAYKINPTNPWYAERLGQTYIKYNHNDQAIAIYKKLAQEHPENMNYVFALTELYKRTNQIPEAIAMLSTAQKNVGSNPDLILEKQNLQLQIKDYEGALEEADQLIKQYPEDYRYLLVKGDIYMDKQDYKKAYKTYTEAQKTFPNNGNVNLALAGYYEAKQDPKHTQQEVLKAFQSEEVDVQRKLSIYANYLQSDLSAKSDSTANPKHKSEVDTNKLLDALVNTNPEDPNVQRFAGVRALDNKDTLNAITHFEKSVQLDPTEKEVWGQLLYLKFQAQQWQSLKTMSQTAGANNALIPQFLLFEGIAEYQLNEFDSAATSYEKGVSYCLPSDQDIKVSLLSSLGDTYYKLERKTDAYKAYDQVLELDEHNLMVLNNYSYFLSLDSQRLDDAERMSKITIDLEPINATFLDTYAWVLHVRGNNEKALEYIEKVVKLNSEEATSPEIWTHYGDILDSLGRRDEARLKWKKAIAYGGDAELLNKKINNEK